MIDKAKDLVPAKKYDTFVGELSDLLEEARRQAARSVNSILTATYWELGRRIVEFDQKGEKRAMYGRALLKKLSVDLTARFGRGYSVDNLELIRRFYLTFPRSKISESMPRKSLLKVKSESPIRKFDTVQLGQIFPLSWTHYVHLMRRTDNPEALEFYAAEALQGGWSVRQLDRQISSQFYERTLISKNKAAMLKKGSQPKPADILTPEEEIKDPFVLEFLGLKDEYSESDLEEALIEHLGHFLMELGGDFAFIARQKRLWIGNKWYRVDLLFFHRLLRCLVVIDLKVGKFTHADAGQMHLYLNYAEEHWTHEDENPPVGLILCAEKDSAVAKYALEGLPNKVMASEYKLALPDEELLIQELNQTRRILEARSLEDTG